MFVLNNKDVNGKLNGAHLLIVSKLLNAFFLHRHLAEIKREINESHTNYVVNMAQCRQTDAIPPF